MGVNAEILQLIVGGGAGSGVIAMLYIVLQRINKMDSKLGHLETQVAHLRGFLDGKGVTAK